MRNLRSNFLVISVVAMIIGGCAPDAPHDNPLDPGSPNSKTDGNLSGRVLALNSLTQGISGALVTIEGTTSAELTAADGSFSFPNAPSGNITIVVSKSMYQTDTLNLTLAVGTNLDTLIHIDALPQITKAWVVTSKIDHWVPGPIYTDTVWAAVMDPDGFLDISDVYLQMDTLARPFAMSHISGNLFQVIINADSLPSQDPEWLIGKQCNVFAVDDENGIGQSSAFYVTRLIESEPSPISPYQDTIATHFPTLDWNPPIVSFDYTYRLQIFSFGGTQTFYWSQSEVSAGTYVFTVSDSLPSGNYYWTVGITDQFGNSACSKEAAFFVP
jgi:Carboxypeptidase regulatory-like domain